MFKNINAASKLIHVIILLLVFSLSIGVISPITSSTDFHADSIATLDKQKVTAMGLSATVTAASYAISAIPNDTGAPIAEQLSDLTAPLMLIVSVIYLEKFLLTTTSYLSFTFLVPLACILLGINLYRPSATLRLWAIKILIFAILLFVLVPTGVAVTNMVQDTFQESIDQTFHLAEQFSEEVENVQEEDSNAFVRFVEGIGEGVVKLLDMAKKILSSVTDAIAVLLITTCGIPVITYLLFTWIIRVLFGIEVNSPKPKALVRARKKKTALSNPHS